MLIINNGIIFIFFFFFFFNCVLNVITIKVRKSEGVRPEFSHSEEGQNKTVLQRRRNLKDIRYN